MQAHLQPRPRKASHRVWAHLAIGATTALTALMLTPRAQAQTETQTPPALAWAVRAGGTGGTSSTNVAVDASGNSYVTGMFDSTTTFGAGQPHETTLTAVGRHDLFLASYDSTGAIRWAKQASGTDSVLAWSLAADAAGNVWIAGYFDQTATFGAGETRQTTLTSVGVNDIFIAKYDSAGNLVWAKDAGGAQEESANDIAVDADGNAWVTGYFQDTATFGAGELNQTTLNGNLGSIFVARYDGNGALVWAKAQNQGTGANGESIAIDASGNSYVIGYFLNSATFGTGEVNQTTLTSVGGNDIFLAKYDSAGALVWAKRAGGVNRDDAFGVAVDQSGNIWMTGTFLDQATFGTGEAGETTLLSDGGKDVFVAKYNDAGTLVWAKRAGGAGTDQGGYIALDASGHAYVAGIYQSPATFGAGETNQTVLTTSQPIDAFLAQFDDGGNLVWAKRAADNLPFGTAMTADSQGRIYLAGGFSGSVTFGAGEANETTLTAIGNPDFYLVRFGTGASQPEVSFDSLANLVSQYVTRPLVKNVLLGEVQLAKGLSEHDQITAMDYVLRVFVYSVTQQTGRSLTQEQAATLIQIANALMQ